MARKPNTIEAAQYLREGDLSKIKELQFFSYTHLPSELQQISKMFADVAVNVMVMLPENPQRSICLRKLLEAKDAGVRAVLYKDE